MERACACVATAEKPKRRNAKRLRKQNKTNPKVYECEMLCVLYFFHLYYNDDSEENGRDPSKNLAYWSLLQHRN